MSEYGILHQVKVILDTVIILDNDVKPFSSFVSAEIQI